MRNRGGRLVFAATDLPRFLACRHLASLSREVALGRRPPPPRRSDPRLQHLADKGREHERNLEAAMEDIAEVSDGPPTEERRRETLALLERGAMTVKQGLIETAAWSGKPDFLQRVERPSRLGPWSYEALDAKLSRRATAAAVLQVAVYSRILARLQEEDPEFMRLALGTGVTEELRATDFAAFERRASRELDNHCRERPETYPEPVSHCQRCPWDRVECRGRRRRDDHLSLVADIQRTHRKRLQEHGITTLTALARLAMPPEPRVPGISRVALEKIHHQARVQLEARKGGGRRHERIGSGQDPARAPEDPEPGRGLLRLPAPSEGDLYFQIERAPFALESGLDFLFGWSTGDGGHEARWALSEHEERRTFEDFLDDVRRRREEHPELHLYSFGGLSAGALKRLAGRHNTRAEELDDLLRRGSFVNLQQIVRQGIRASVEAYGLRELEPFTGFRRRVRRQDAYAARLHIEVALAQGNASAPFRARDRATVEAENRDACGSFRALHRWVLRERAALVAEVGEQPWFVVGTPEAEEPTEERLKIEALKEALTRDAPDDPEERDEEQRARQLLADLLEYHRREDKSLWWQYFAWQEMTLAERMDDRYALAGLVFEGEAGRVDRSVLLRYRYDPDQDHDIRPGMRPWDPDADDWCGHVEEVDDETGTLILKRAHWVRKDHPRSLVPFEGVVPTQSLRRALFALAEHVVSEGFREDSPRRAAWDLLLRHVPRLGASGVAEGASLVGAGETTLEAGKRLVTALDRSVVPVQGPPGTGKTYTGARMITELVRAGKRVGVTAQSHKVIRNLLDGVARAAGADRKRGARGWLADRILQKDSPEKYAAEDGWKDPVLVMKNASGARSAALSGRYPVIGGTAWLWASPDMADSVDVLFIDEAGQFSLVNALASVHAAKSLVLLGDPRQLDQVTTGVHPPGADASVLGHLLGEEKNLSPHRGLFLEDTWRMHPDICRFPSEQFYENRLGSRPALARQRIHALGPLNGAGLRFLPVEHQEKGNRTGSDEEVDAIRGLVAGLLKEQASWTTAEGKREPLTIEDILVISPYNNQVAKLTRALTDETFPPGARVGTVDRFQGQEAPLVIYSMATSTPEEAPRGMDFLYSLNRFNVATSRARAVAAVVASPALLLPECHTPQQLRLANALCRFVELASPTDCRSAEMTGRLN